MRAIGVILQVMIGAITVWLTISFLFQLFVSFFGFRKKTKDYEEHPPTQRFLVLVPAHNEESVIGDIIENLKHMEYPKELYDFYILADNCSDRTADIARQMGANVLEFHKASEDEPTGKSVVLQKAFNTLKGYQDKYDLVMFFDADNLIDPNMFLEVNSQYMSHDNVVMIQCYLGCKNNKGPVAQFYYITYTIANRFLQYGRLRLGLNCGIGGTGFAVTTSYLYKRGGWTVMSLTEDTELQFAATLEGKKILWNHHVRVYDEKPTSWKASYRQRVRWAQGHWFVAFKNTKKLFRAIAQKRISKGEFISTLVQMYFPSTYVAALINIILMLVYSVLTWSRTAPVWPVLSSFGLAVFNSIPGIILFVYSLYIQFAWGDRVDNGIRFSVRSIIPIFISFFLNSILAGFAQVVGLFKYKQQNTWVKTEHSLNSLEEGALQLTGSQDLLSELVATEHNEKTA